MVTLEQLKKEADGGHFSPELVDQIIQNWEDYKPALLEAVKADADTAAKWVNKPEQALFECALILLADYQEEGAWDAAAAVVKSPAASHLLRAYTDLLPAILANLLNEEPERLITDLVLDESVSEEIRTAAIEAPLVLLGEEFLERDEVVALFKTAIEKLPKKEDCPVWSMLIAGINAIHPGELEDQVREAINAGCHLITKDTQELDDRLEELPADCLEEIEADETLRFFELEEMAEYWAGGAMPGEEMLDLVDELRERDPKGFAQLMSASIYAVCDGSLKGEFPEPAYYGATKDQFERFIEVASEEGEELEDYPKLLKLCGVEMTERLNAESERIVQYMLEDQLNELEAEEKAAEPVRREQPKVGRNDPCTCGSGKKFKKCCGQ